MKQDIVIDTLEFLDEWIRYQVFYKQIPSLQIGVVVGDKIITRNYGYQNSKQKTTDTTQYKIASNSKLFTAISILQLQEKKLLNVNDKITKHLPWLNSKDPNVKKITIKQILTHTANLETDGKLRGWQDNKFATREEVKKHLQGKVTTPSSKKRFKYSNFGFAVLGLIIEEVSKQSYDDFVTQNILKKLGMKDTQTDFENQPNLSVGYGRIIFGEERMIVENKKCNAMSSAAGLISNVTDLCKFLQAQFDGKEKLLKNSTLKEMRAPQIKVDKQMNWGMGYMISKADKKNIYGHTGGFPGYITRTGYNPELKVGIVCLSNGGEGHSQIIFNAIFSSIIKLSKKFKKSTSKFDKYKGVYRVGWADVVVGVINNELVYYGVKDTNPVTGAIHLKPLKKDFLITTKDGFEPVGEKAVFSHKNSKITGLAIGSHYFDKVN